MRELVALLTADTRSVVHRLSRGSWGERLAGTAALLVAAGFVWGCHLFFLRIFNGILGLRTVESMLPTQMRASLDLLTGQLLAMTALTALSALLASSLVTGLSSMVQSRDLPELLSMPIPAWSLFGHRLIRSALASGAPILLFLLPTASALGRAWGRPWPVMMMAAVSGILLVTATAAVGMILVLSLLRLFPAGRAAQTITSVSMLSLVIIIAAIRAVRPERLFSPASGEDLVSALESMRLPALEYYPSTWMTRSWMAAATGDSPWAPLTALGLGTVVCVCLGAIVFCLWHRLAWMRAREAPPPSLPGSRWAAGFGRRLARMLPPPMAAVARLEVANLTRDAGQWTQIALLAALAGLYLYNLKLIPGHQEVLGPLLALLNVGVAGLVISAVALRLGLPSVSRDGPSRWLPEVSPLTPFRRLVAKVVVVGTPLCLMGGGVTVLAGMLLNAPDGLRMHATVTVFMIGPTVAAMAVGVGARFPRYGAADPVQTAVSAGGLLGFASMMLYVGLMTVLAARPVFAWYAVRVGFDVGPLSLATTAVGLQLSLSVVLALSALYWGARRLERGA